MAEAKRKRLEAEPAITDAPTSRGNTLIVLCGLTGSGKSTFAEEFIELMEKQGDHSWRRVSQDLLKTKPRCKEAVKTALERGDNVVLDRTNLSEEQVKDLLPFDFCYFSNSLSSFLSRYV